MLDLPLVRKLIDLAIEEDLSLGDVTSALTVPRDHRSKAIIVAREKLVACGLQIVPLVIEQGRWDIDCRVMGQDGAWVPDGEVLVELSGRTQHMLEAERTLLNFLQRLSGVATKTRKTVEGLSGSTGMLSVLDTRKTMPGWRLLDKYSVRVGGGRNHRMNLGDMVLVKNNHIDSHPGGIRGALAAVVSGKPLYMPWEVEVRSLKELEIALEYRPTIIMLDNFSDDLISAAVKLVKESTHKPMIEASGGMTPERIQRLEASGVDAISMGGLTTAAPNVDISMRITA